jgi:hypothetical protein
LSSNNKDTPSGLPTLCATVIPDDQTSTSSRERRYRGGSEAWLAPLVTTDIPIDPVDVAAVFLGASVGCADHVLDGIVFSSVAGLTPGLVALVTVQFSLVVEMEAVVELEVVVEPENVRDGVGLG